MLFQNLLQKLWVTKGNDAQTAILVINAISKKTLFLTYVSIVNFVDHDKMDQKIFQFDTKIHSLDLY